MKPRTLIVRTAGTNCDAETAYTFELAGAECEKVHVNRLLAEPRILDQFQMLAFAGGFSYGDDIASGKILANQLAHHLADDLRRFVEQGKPVIGICNGFQVLVKTALLPGQVIGQSGKSCTLAHNDSGRFIDRWIRLAPRGNRCIWTRGLAPLELPIAHGEGKFVFPDQAYRQAMWDNEQVALVYAKPDASAAGGALPYNPNGSMDDIAGVCDPTGLVFGLMPHPERYVDATQHYAWTSQLPLPTRGQGLAIFENAVSHVAAAVGAGA